MTTLPETRRSWSRLTMAWREHRQLRDESRIRRAMVEAFERAEHLPKTQEAIFRAFTTMRAEVSERACAGAAPA